MFPHLYFLAQATHPANGSLEIFHVRLIGLTPENGRKLILTLGFLFVVVLAHYILRGIARLSARIARTEKIVFWVRQIISLLLAVMFIIGTLSIWFNDPGRLATFMGFITAGVAFALQKPISALAGYLVILRGKTFTVGDRITMGGVRGDVVALRFTQTAIMEMGQPPDVQDADPPIWVHARQYTGRIVTVPNSKIFDEAVYNYTRDFPYLWEELRLPISYNDDRRKVETILLDVAMRHTIKIRDLGAEALREMRRRYFLPEEDFTPRTFWRLTDNWLEMTVRFVAPTHDVRKLKDIMSRDILAALDDAKIGIASSTYDIVGMPRLEVHVNANSPISPTDQSGSFH